MHSTSATVMDLDALRECRDCGLFQTVRDVPDGAVARCSRCDALLRRAASGCSRTSSIGTPKR
jgi:uncharacterized paraquat-inducible protein A